MTPLIRGVPGLTEKDAGGRTPINAADTVLIPQFHDLRVERPLNDGCIANVKLSMHWDHAPAVGDAIEALDALKQALWIGFWRPGEHAAEAIFWGQCNVIDDFENEVVELVGADPYAGKARSHYIRRGDPALNIDKERGSLPAHAFSAEPIFDAARNTQPQQDRLMPALALADYYMAWFTDPALEDAAPLEFERGQEVNALHQLILESFNGPDMDVRPAYWFPADFYAYAEHYDSPQHAIPAPGGSWGTTLGRNLDPADPDDPQPGEVVFQMGYEGNPDLPPGTRDNITACRVEPSKPVTHQHYLDASRHYRVTVADAASSYDIGAWVGFNQADFTITRPTRTAAADKTALVELARAIVAAYGVPPKHIAIKLRRPDLAGMFLYGHPTWPSTVPSGTPRIGGAWYLGDYVRVRASKGRRRFDALARIIKVIFSQQGSNDLPEVDVELIPAEGGTPGANTDHPDADAAPTIVITSPLNGATVSGTVPITADAWDDVGVASVEFRVDGAPITGGFLVSPPWQVAWDTTLVTDGSHTLTAIATDTAGNQTVSAVVTVAVGNGAPAPPPDPPPPTGSNLVYVDGRRIRNVSDASNANLRGGNVHTAGFSFSQADFDSMAANGWNCIRLCAQWDNIETSPGVFSQAELNHVHTSIQRAAAAGLRVILCQGINAPQWSTRASVLPWWSYDDSGPTGPAVAPWTGTYLFHVFMRHGEAYSRKMVQEFSGYENVAGFDPWNEPDSTSAAVVQQGMNEWLGWVRAEAAGAGKLWFVTNLYSSQSSADAFNNWAAITDWTNVVLQVHSYFAPKSPTDTGWSTSNGMRKSGDGTFWNGSPEATYYDTVNKAALRNHFAPWKQTSQARNVPVILGEAGVQYFKTTSTQRANWGRDIVEAAELEEFAGVFWWIYATSSGQDDWTARLSGPWRPEAAEFGTFVSF